MSLSIGADVGETDTTAVILKEKEVLCSYEVSTTQDVTSDMIDAIKLVLRQLPEEDAHNRGENFERVSIGTTNSRMLSNKEKTIQRWLCSGCVTLQLSLFHHHP